MLVDAPCTGTGTWRRNPDAKWRLRPEDLAELTALQADILDSAQRLVKPGGRLIYVTCSLLREENEDAGRALSSPRMRISRCCRSREVWRDDGRRRPARRAATMLRLTPARHGTDGFFVAVMERKALAPAHGRRR